MKRDRRAKPPTSRRPMGWRKDPYDRRDKIRRLPKVRLPENVDLFHLMPPVRDQGQIGACVGFGIGANLYAQGLIDLAQLQEWFSPTWIYNGARFLEGTLRQDCGCYPRSALEWLTAKGALPEHFWPYDPMVLDRRTPPSALEPEAAKFPVLQYERVIGGAEGIMVALAEGKPVSIGTPWYAKWMDFPGGIMPEITQSDAPEGGHETCLYGYTLHNGKVHFLMQNSWGDSWAFQGRAWLPASAFAVFTRHGGYDAHTIDVDWTGTAPPPPPDPKPKDSLTLKILAGILIGGALIAFALHFIL